jgi:hypothetical protein
MGWRCVPFAPVLTAPGRHFCWYDAAVLRRLFTLASALSLLLCLIFVGLRIRGALTNDYLSRAVGGRCTAVNSSGDWLIIRECGGWPVDEPLQWQHGSGALGPSLERTDISGMQVAVLLDSQNRPVRVRDLDEGGAHVSGPMQVRVVYVLGYSNRIVMTAVLPLLWLSVWVSRRTKAAARGTA